MPDDNDGSYQGGWLQAKAIIDNKRKFFTCPKCSLFLYQKSKSAMAALIRTIIAATIQSHRTCKKHQVPSINFPIAKITNNIIQ